MILVHKMYARASLITSIARVLKNLFLQRSFIKENIQPLLANAHLHNDGTLDSEDFKKITHYYGLAVPAILGEAFCALHNKKMSPGERMSATSQGAMTGLFDDFFDKQYLSDASIEQIIKDHDLHYKKSNEKLFSVFYKNALIHVPDKNVMLQALTTVYKAQLESKKQGRQTLSADELYDITFYKGGTSLLFYRTAFSPLPSQTEEKLLYNLGGLMQLANDIFDVYKDRQNGIRTLITEATHISHIRNIFRQQLELNYMLAYRTGFAIEDVKRFLSILSLGIFSRAFVCLDQLENNELITDNEFSVLKYSREQLICDMDTKKNMLSSAAYFMKITEKIY